MNAAAQHTLQVIPNILIGYGHSDEYSFVFHKSTTLFERRSAKIASTVVSTFTAAYVHLWPTIFNNGQDSSHADNAQSKDVPLDLSHLPTFDSRTVLYPSINNLRDYMSWRQADCHINNLYNTTFWTLVQRGGMSNTEAEELLKGTLSSDKNEILWSKFSLNYNNEPEIFRKGSVVYRAYELEQATSQSQMNVKAAKGSSEDNEYEQVEEISKTQKEKMKKARQKAQVVVEHIDIIRDDFWTVRPWLLSGKPGKPAMEEPIRA